MSHVEGTVKKYIREYSRKLKNGKNKKYQTRQVQITLSKKDDIFQDEEEVIVMNKNVFREYEKLNFTIGSLKREIETLKNDQEEEFGEKIDKLNREHIFLQDEHVLLKKELNLLKEVKHYKDLNDKLKELILSLT